MATSYDEIYEFFLSKISDYSFLKLSESDLKEILVVYLKTSISKFESSKYDLLDRDETIGQFNADITDKEKDILASLMVVEFLRPKVVASKNYEMSMSDSDYKLYSQANHIKELLNLYKEMRLEVDKLMTKYSYKQKNLDGLT